MLTIAGNVVKYLRYWKTALKNRAFRCCFQREGDGESPSANLSAASLERPRESAAGASRYKSAEICVGIIRVVPRLTSPLSQGRGFYFMDKACPCRALHDKGRWHLRQQMTEGICCGFQSAPKFAAFESPQALCASVHPPFGNEKEQAVWLALWLVFDQIARSTLLERRHLVQTYTWRGVPSTIALTRLTLGFHARFARL